MLLMLLIYLFLFYVRPSEWVPGLVGTPLIMFVGMASLLAIGVGVFTRKYPHILSENTEKMMSGFIVAIMCSHLSHGFFGGATKSMESFLPSLVCFLLVSCALNSRSKITNFILALILLTTFLAFEGWKQHETGYSHGGMEPYYEVKSNDEGAIIKSARIRWFGYFNDPNDLGLALVLVLPFLLNMLIQKRFLIPLSSLPLVLLAIYFTNSRGTVLAGLVSIAMYFVILFRSAKGILFGSFLALALFTFGPSRLANISSGEESAYGRIEAWNQAFQMFKANPFFGVGKGMFTDFHPLTAHNSFVLVMAELGFVGLFFYTGLFYFPFYWLWSEVNNKEIDKISLNRSPDYGLICSVFASLTGMMAAMFFISRSYTLFPFMMISLTMAVIRVYEKDKRTTLTVNEKPPLHFRNIFVLTVFQIIALNIVVKLTI